jgi:hypothetical protein
MRECQNVGVSHYNNRTIHQTFHFIHSYTKSKNKQRYEIKRGYLKEAFSNWVRYIPFIQREKHIIHIIDIRYQKNTYKYQKECFKIWYVCKENTLYVV